MKKIIPIGIICILFLLAGCSQTKTETQETPSASPVGTESPTPTPSPTPTESTTPTPSPTLTPTQSPKTKKKKDKKTIALTFDDGPGEYTPEILKILNEENVPATFFVIGQQVPSNAKTVKALSDSGMKVESHTWNHANMVYLSPQGMKDNNTKTEKAIEEITQKEVTCIRPPYGSVNKSVRSTMKKQDNKIVLWDIDPQDWARPGAKSIVKNVKQYHHDDAVILMHDGGGDRSQTVEALPEIIRFLKSQDYEFVFAC